MLSSLLDESDGMVRIVEQGEVSGGKSLVGRSKCIVPTVNVSRLAQTANEVSILFDHVAQIFFCSVEKASGIRFCILLGDSGKQIEGCPGGDEPVLDLLLPHKIESHTELKRGPMLHG